jgi:hypothetical protein
MAIRTNLLIKLLKTFRADAIVYGFANGLAVMNADGTREVALLNATTTQSPRNKGQSKESVVSS